MINNKGQRWLLPPGPCAKHHTLTVELLSHHFTDKVRHSETNLWAQEAWWGGTEPDTWKIPALES